MNKEKQYWFEKFYSIYKDCSLHAVSFYSYDGKVIASVFYKDQVGQKRIDTYTNYDRHFVIDYKDEGGNIECQNTPLPTALFQDEKNIDYGRYWFTYIQAW